MDFEAKLTPDFLNKFVDLSLHVAFAIFSSLQLWDIRFGLGVAKS